METPCPLCSNPSPDPLPCSFPDMLQCPSCSFIFADPRPVDNAPASYEEDFASHTRHPTYQKVDGEYVIRNETKLSALLRSLERFRTDGNLLDMGCSAAFFLKLAEKHGWVPKGVEISEFGAKFSKEELGIDVFHGTLEEAAFPDEMFDIVFSSHVMEHVCSPLPVLQEIKRVLRSGGAVVTVIPTQFSSPAYRFWGDLYGDGPPRHVSFYTRKTYRAFLETAGFQVLRSRHNVELYRLRQLATDGRIQEAPDPVNKISDQPGQTPPSYGPGISFLKSVVNWLATPLGIGDELVSFAIKP